MAAKEKGKIVSASPDSPTLEKLSTFSQQIRSALHCFSAVATRANALRQRLRRYSSHRQCHVATRANALWQSTMSTSFCGLSNRRNPRECAVAKKRVIPAFKCEAGRNPRECAVAKGSELRRLIGRTCRNPRECAVAKIVPPCAAEKGRSVATRANALRQSQYRHGSLTASPSRNPRECAEAKRCYRGVHTHTAQSQPARMR